MREQRPVRSSLLAVLIVASGWAGFTAHPALSQLSQILDHTDLPPLQAEFTRVFYQGSTADTVRGSIYFQDADLLYLEVSHPVNQIIIIDNEAFVTKVFYPDKNRGFILNGKAAADLPIVPGLAASIQSDYGLEGLGLTIHDQRLEGDSLISYWSHPNRKLVPGEFKLVQIGDALTRVTYEVPEAGTRLEARLTEHEVLNNFHIPTVLYTEESTPTSTTKEVIRLANLTLDPQIPEYFINFRFPADADVSERSW